jgi:hypothetical protein
LTEQQKQNTVDGHPESEFRAAYISALWRAMAVTGKGYRHQGHREAPVAAPVKTVGAVKHARLEIVRERPPIFDRIVAVFPGAAEPGVIFAYGGKIYAPGNVKVTRELDAHERVHIARQGEDCDAWWDRYLRDPEFRFEEEFEAHLVEYRTFVKRHIDPVKRARALREIAGKLASPLYNLPGIRLDQIVYRLQGSA